MREHRPLISIGMPVYNGQDFLAEALDSLLAQTFQDFELIISDNASNDGTAVICQEYAAKDKRLHYYRSDDNLGAAANYNRVFDLSSGKYFKWAAHDDMCAPTFLERCVEVLESQPTVVLCYPQTILIDDQGSTIGQYADNLDLRSTSAHERYRQFFDRQGLCHPIFGLIRSSALKSTPLIGNFHSSDRVLLGELVLHGEFCELPDRLFYRRIHPKISMTANKTDNEITAWYDPAERDKILFPRWRRLVEYFKGIGRAPLDWRERALCYAQLGRFVLFPERWGGLFGDLWKAVKLASLSKFGQYQ